MQRNNSFPFVYNLLIGHTVPGYTERKLSETYGKPGENMILFPKHSWARTPRILRGCGGGSTIQKVRMLLQWGPEAGGVITLTPCVPRYVSKHTWARGGNPLLKAKVRVPLPARLLFSNPPALGAIFLDFPKNPPKIAQNHHKMFKIFYFFGPIFTTFRALSPLPPS